MTASELTDWIALFLPDVEPDGQGGYRETVPDDLSPDRAANVRQIAASAVASGDQTMADRVRYRVTIRYDAGVTASARVLWNDMYLDITGVENVDMASEWLVLVCERKEAGTQ